VDTKLDICVFIVTPLIIFVLCLFKVLEGYGQTEATAGITFTIPGDCSSGLYILLLKYSQTCIKRSPLRQRKNGLIRQVTS